MHHKNREAEMIESLLWHQNLQPCWIAE